MAGIDSSIHSQKLEGETSATSSFSNLELVIFQCGKCNAIIGDSMSWVAATKSLRSITLAGATKCVGVRQTLQLGETGVDHGSTFHMVYCMGCDTVLGKKYVASPPELDHLRGGFTFYVEKLNSYEVGSAAVPGSTGGDLTIKALDERIQKTQSMLGNLERRLKEIEALVLSPSKHKSQLPCQTSEENTLSECVETDSVSSTDVGAHSDGGMIQSDAGLRNYAGYSRAVTLQKSGNSGSIPLSDSLDLNKRLKRKRIA